MIRICCFGSCGTGCLTSGIKSILVQVDGKELWFCSKTHAVWYLLDSLKGHFEVTKVDEYRLADAKRRVNEIGKPFKESL